jgi:hypothetical protein
MIAVPYLLAQSFGGLSVYVAGVVIAMLAMHRHSLRNPRALLAVCAIVITVAGLVFIPSPISSRISQVLSGNDPSVDSRTVSSLVVAQIVVAHRSAWWGVGLGQAKLVDLPAGGLAFTRAVIPNSVAATYAELGIVGVVLRISLELYLFFHTRVYDNSFRLAMFTAAFFMQFTGGFIEETREYIIWGFAFCSFFPEFSLRRAARPVSH